ncbi:hypothetical protein [Paractinoplanes rishiriensis]|uniref:Uncharacterized protein n=1 Tax=Paractinoplanes rishiriensis TaxID=1050105 RepID=A0A919MUP2_9ACTN|nr:hypothetical protein [Actinoplanes rishiriensis]GIE95559.1 hypothetical protein Ari01nite_30240 [Actinoplanes rishiriensis]
MQLTTLVAAGSLIVGGLTLIAGRMDRRREQLRRIEVSIEDTLLWRSRNAQPQPWQHLDVFWNQNRVDNPRMVGVEFRNAGRVELRDCDMSEPPTVEFADGTILTASVYLVPKDWPAPRPLTAVSHSGNRAEIRGILLNPGDTLVFQLLVDGGVTPPSCYLHAGGFTVTGRTDTTNFAGRLTRAAGLLAVVAATLGIVINR